MCTGTCVTSRWVQLGWRWLPSSQLFKAAVCTTCYRVDKLQLTFTWPAASSRSHAVTISSTTLQSFHARVNLPTVVLLLRLKGVKVPGSVPGQGMSTPLPLASVHTTEAAASSQHAHVLACTCGSVQVHRYQPVSYTCAAVIRVGPQR